MKAILIKPLEWFVLAPGCFVVFLLYIQIVITPAFLLPLTALWPLSLVAPDNIETILGALALVGTVLGIVWAERIRKQHGIVTFHAYLLSTPEIDGWRDANGKVIRKHKQQPRRPHRQGAG